MTPSPKPLSGKEVIKLLEENGYSVSRTKGSHVRLRHPEKPSITVPLHKELKIGLQLKILKDAGISRENL